MRLSPLLNKFSDRSCGGPPPIISNDAVHLAESKFTKRTCARPSLFCNKQPNWPIWRTHTPNTNASLFLNEQTLAQPWPSSTFALFQRSPLTGPLAPRACWASASHSKFRFSSFCFDLISCVISNTNNIVLYIRVAHGEWWVSQAGREAEEAYLLILLALCPADKRFL
jgi:hypothetical protein